ncbi:tetratricopeptide repeat protein [Actinoplanes sp. NBRC 103695]|uniref:tetratricopeptide repeat protein n=1 Tax=Actinoplanes sp. NBRC 103695 TaxID=3032202 RepID=UPI0024A131F5|nr:tetratricopeptide repeat protein [Actinoplanes sp. NBRC 103695]GLZ02176.1 hypothetical protein Acsp02_94270 [Actinoplanes sp. NBRC 103695]
MGTLHRTLAEVSAHRRRRGPYTAAGSLLRQILPDILARRPDLGVRHHIEILTAAPEFAGQVPPILATLESTMMSGTRTRYQSRVHTLRIANGLAELLRDSLTEPGTLIVEDVHEADETDREWLDVVRRRISPDLLTVVHTSTSVVPGDAQAYVDADGIGVDDAAYLSLAPAARAALHDARLSLLLAGGVGAYGAVCWHAERGSDPRGPGLLRAAQVHCKDHGLYHAAIDLGRRGRALVDREAQPDLWWDFTGDMTTSLAASGQADEAAAAYHEIRALTEDPEMQMHAAYGTAMLFARHHAEGRRDPVTARGWLNVAIALAGALPEKKDRIFYEVFNRNGLALVEVRDGRPEEALRLVTEGIDRLDRELEPDDQLLHRTGLRYNRALVHVMLGDLPAALADYDHVIAVDPHFHDHWFNRGNVLRRLGRTAEALADYDRALALSPPFAEAYYNRGDAHAALGELEAAAADFGRAAELDPPNTPARLSRAEILADLGETAAALTETRVALADDPGHAGLHCLTARLLGELGRGEDAREAVSRALLLDDNCAEAYAIRSALSFEAGDLTAALTDLDRAIAVRETPELVFNRGVVHQAAGSWDRARADYAAVVAATGDPDAEERLAAVAAR